MTVDLIKVMNEVGAFVNDEGDKIHGKSYAKVQDRVNIFRRNFGLDYKIETDLIHNDDKKIIVQAVIRDKDNHVIASGLAEEISGSSKINTVSAVEVCDTSAIGRALSCLGLSGGEYASANEIDNVDRKQYQQLSNDMISMVEEVFEVFLPSKTTVQEVQSFWTSNNSVFNNLKETHPTEYEKIKEKFSDRIKTIRKGEDNG